MTSNLNNGFSNMGICCALGVVFIHAGGGGNVVSQFFYQVVGWGICSIAVPYFFFASGYFLGRHFWETNWYRNAILSRIRTLVFPFVFWNLAYLFYNFILWCMTPTLSRVELALGLDPFKQPLLYPLWYIRSLMVLVVFSPIIGIAIGKLKKWYFVILAPIYLIACGVCNRYSHWPFLFYSLFSLAGYFYFGLGIYVCKYGCDFSFMRQHKSMLAVCGLGAVIIGRLALLCGYRSVADCLWIIGIPPLLFVCWGLVKGLRIPRWITNASFCVYVLHVFVLDGIRRYVGLSGDSVTGYLVCGFMAFLICVAVDVVFRRLTPCTWRILMGGR